MRADAKAEARFGIDPRPVAPKPELPAKRQSAVSPVSMANGHATRTLKSGEIMIGAAETVGIGPVGLSLPRLVAGRLMIQGVSGAGKSWTLRRLLEQTAGLIQHVVIDPERAFKGLAGHYAYLWVDGAKLDAAALAALARRVREHRISIVLDLFDRDLEAQMMAAAAFLAPLVNAPREHWHAALVAIDEAHRFAPFGGQAGEALSVRKESVAAVVDLMSRGRKRGLCGVLATQRLARLSKSVASEILNFLIGLNVLDRDIARAAETIGWASRRAYDRLPAMRPGDFVAVGPAFTAASCVLRVGKVETVHVDETPAITAPPAISPERAAELLELRDLEDISARDAALRAENAAPPGLAAVRGFVRDRDFVTAAKIWEALLALLPDGAFLTELAERFHLSRQRLHEVLALLDRYGTLEFTGDGEPRAVHIARNMTQRGGGAHGEAASAASRVSRSGGAAS